MTAVARKAAYRRLLAAIAQAERGPTGRLAPLRTLAAEAAVSYASMARALRLVEDEGRVTVVHGRGVFATRSPTLTHASSTAGSSLLHELGPRWMRVKRRLTHDILTGVFRVADTLPPPKELCARYGASHRSLRRALAALAEERHLQPHRRSYRPMIASVADTRVGVGHVFRAVLGEPTPGTERSAEIIPLLDAECGRARLRLVPYPVSLDQQVENHEIRAWVRETTRQGGAGRMHGVVISGDALEGRVVDLCDRFTRQGLPVALLLARSHMPRTPAFAASGASARLTVVNWVMDRQAGLDVGRYLLRLGHRRVAYLGPQLEIRWSHDRLGGLRDAFNEAGIANAVDACLLRFRDLSPWRVALGGAPSRGGTPDWDRIVRSLLVPGEDLSSRFRDYLTTRYGAAASPLNSTPLLWLSGFESAAVEALRHRDVTAWVCGNEEVSMLASDFLASRGKRVPADLSLIGIDDCNMTLRRSLSMYNFGGHEAVHAALASLLWPRKTAHARPPVEHVWIEGRTRERGTVGPPSR